ncbi:SIR2 family protein [Salibacterium lacus]|uniref:SIR2 family protein n=1 Tax=Salibacterium lacus TaxID=1898109 RepID=A0ABW5SWJ8_9BACI
MKIGGRSIGVTVILGAGAAIDIGAPATLRITDMITKGHLSRSEPWVFIRELKEKLDDYYNCKANFEDLLHCVETLLNYTRPLKELNSKHKPVLGEFMQIIDPKYINHLNLYKSKIEILETIFEEIRKYDSKFNVPENHKFYSNFWSDLCNLVSTDIYNLNYDRTIQNSLIENGIEFEEGFINDPLRENVKKFNPENLYSASNKVVNLHGSIYFGFKKDLSNEDLLNYNFQDLYLHLSSLDAKETWGRKTGRSDILTQSGEKVISSPIITGLRKLEKLNVAPFNFYHSLLPMSIVNNSSLLIIGYSFGDDHINSYIEKHRLIHGKSSKVCLITFMDKEDKKTWHHNISEMSKLTGFINHEMFSFIAKASNESNPETTFEYKNPHESRDKNFRMYFGGFKDTVDNYKKEILEFLNS